MKLRNDSALLSLMIVAKRLGVISEKNGNTTSNKLLAAFASAVSGTTRKLFSL